MKSYTGKDARLWSIASGVIATLAAAFSAEILLLNILEQMKMSSMYGSKMGLDGVLYLIVFPIIEIASMGLCAVYAYTFYGKKKPVSLGLSAALMGGLSTYYFLFAVLNIKPILEKQIPLYYFRSTMYLLASVVYIVIAVKYLANFNMNIRVLTVALVVTRITEYFGPMLFGYRHVLSGSIVFRLTYVIPFLIFAFFCPVDNIVANTETGSHVREQAPKDQSLHLAQENE